MISLKRTLVCITSSTLLMFALPAQAELVFAHSNAHQVIDEQNNSASEESILELLEVMRINDQMLNMLDAQREMIRPMIESLIDLEDLTVDQQEAFISLSTDYAEELIDNTSEELIAISIKNFISVAKKHYTQQEVDAQLKFYNSEVGQSILDKQPQVLQEYSRLVLPETIQLMEAQIRQLQPELKRQLEEVKNQ